LTPQFSVVVPAYHEADYLPRLLDSLDVARSRFHGSAAAIEIIVADNISTDATAVVARSRGCRVVDVKKRAIGAARNGAAVAATGAIGCYFDTDIRIHPDTFNAIAVHMATGKHVGGAAGWVAERMPLGLVLTTALVRSLTWLAGVNAGVVFCRADVFRAIGGYNEARRFGEDVEFLRTMRKAAKQRGLRTFWSKRTPAVVTTRKFDHHGDWHMFAMGLWVLRNRSVEKTVDDCRYNDDERF
jgi:glycosyltransferase involved in cell wall biosynthesis